MKFQNYFIYLFFFIICCFACQQSPKHGTTKNQNLLTTKGPLKQWFQSTLETDLSISTFPCSGRIYSFLQFPSDFIGQHHINGFWIKPNGEAQENSSLNVDFKDDKKQKAVNLWIEFKTPSVINLDNHTSDEIETKKNFHGIWTFKAECDGIEVVKSTFTVICN